MFTIEDASTPRRAGDPSPRVDDAEEDFYDSGPESPMRRLVVVDPTSSGARAISRRQREVFGGRHATVISTDVQLIAGGGVLAVVLGTLSKGSSLRSRHRGAAKPVTFMHNFILERRVDADRADRRPRRRRRAALLSRRFHHRQRSVPPRGSRRVPRRHRRVRTSSGVIAAPDAPEGARRRRRRRDAVPNLGGANDGRRTDADADADADSDSGPRWTRRTDGGAAATPTRTPRKPPASPRADDEPDAAPLASPNPFVDESEAELRVKGTDVGVGAGVGAGDGVDAGPKSSGPLASGNPLAAGNPRVVLGVGDRPTSPDARAIPLPSPSLLDSSSRPASSESRLRRSARRYSSDFDDEGTRRALFDRAASPYDDTHHSGRAMERAGDEVFSRDGTQRDRDAMADSRVLRRRRPIARDASSRPRHRRPR